MSSGPQFHGVKNQTLPTTYRLTQLANADVPVFVGLAPVGRVVGGAAMVNVAYKAVDPDLTLATFGYDSPTIPANGPAPNFGPWNLSEVYYATFTLFNQWNKPAPILINVFNPAIHKTTVAPTSMAVSNGIITLAYDPVNRIAAMIDSVIVQPVGGGSTLIKGTDYITGYDDNNNLLITITDLNPSANYLVGYNKENPTMVTASTIVGGTLSSGANTGLECIEDVWPQLTTVPGILYSPGFMQNTTVQAAADARVQSVNGIFKARTMIDLDDTINATNFEAACTLKGTDALQDSREDICWPPCATAAGMQFHLGTLLVILEGVVTQTRGNGVPYWSVSNNLLPITGVCLSNGIAVTVHPPDALILNQQGIITVQKQTDGWFAWGNRTAANTFSTDVVECFAIVQREFDWIENSLAITMRPWVDNPTNGTLLQSIMMSVQIWLSSLVSRQALLYGLIEFLSIDNPLSNLLMAMITFHYLLTPPLPAEQINNNFEFDVSGLQTLFTLISSNLTTAGAPTGGGLSIG